MKILQAIGAWILIILTIMAIWILIKEPDPLGLIGDTLHSVID